MEVSLSAKIDDICYDMYYMLKDILESGKFNNKEYTDDFIKFLKANLEKYIVVKDATNSNLICKTKLRIRL